jgi:DNA-directed RNA polymerase subunit RPC12/RpoP
MNSTLRRIDFLKTEWMLDKNGSELDLEVLTHSARYWWKCSTCSHEWQTTIIKRLQYNRGCHKCGLKLGARKRSEVTSIKNNFFKQYPHLRKEWDEKKNARSAKSVPSGSNEKFWWICDQGHSFEQLPFKRTKTKGCPYCSHHIMDPLINGIAVTHSHLIDEWSDRNGFSPLIEEPKVSNKYFWTCRTCNHEWEAFLGNRKNGRGCPECARINSAAARAKSKLENGYSLAERFPKLANELHTSLNKFKATDVTYGSKEIAFWQCSSCDHVWETSICNRTKKVGQTGCPRCSILFSKFEDSVHEELKFLTNSKIFQNRYPMRAKTGERLQIDLFIPELKLGFEVQDFASHSKDSDREICRNQNWMEFKHGPTYHESKRSEAKAQLDVDLYDIWEDEILDQSFKLRLQTIFDKINQ